LSDATDEDVNAVIKSFDSQLHQTHRLRSCINHISGVLGAGGGVLVKNALALDNKSLANATDEDVNAVIKSFDSQLHQTHRLPSRINHISGVLGAGGGVLVEDALGEMSLADLSDGDLDVIIKSLQSVAQGRKSSAYKTMSAEEERQLTEKTTSRHQESLKDYDECLEQKFIKGSGEWRHRKLGKFSVEEIKIIMDAESDWNTKKYEQKNRRMLVLGYVHIRKDVCGWRNAIDGITFNNCIILLYMCFVYV
jgi:hypothetical protein